jgi:hypothetical protein
MAMAETLHSRLSPRAPAAKIPRGPEYSLAFTLVSLLGGSGEGFGVRGVEISMGLVVSVFFLDIISQISLDRV